MGNSVGRFQYFRAPLAGLAAEVRIRFLEHSYFPPSAAGLRQAALLIPTFYAASVIALLCAGTGGARLLAALAGVYFAVFGVFDGSKAAFYLVHFTPLLACCAGCWVTAEWQRAGWRGRVAAGLATLLIMLNISWIGYGIRRDSYRNAYLPAIAYLNHHAGVDDLIFAASEFAFGLGFCGRFRDDSTLGLFHGQARGLYCGGATRIRRSLSRFCQTEPGA